MRRAPATEEATAIPPPAELTRSLIQAAGFTQADLETNRQGQQTDRQKHMLSSWGTHQATHRMRVAVIYTGITAALVGCPGLVVLLTSLRTPRMRPYIPGNIGALVVLIVMVGLVWLVARSLLRVYHGLDERPVLSVNGIPKFGGWHNSDAWPVVIRVGKQVFPVTEPVARALNFLVPYRFYYIRQPPEYTFLSAEALDIPGAGSGD